VGKRLAKNPAHDRGWVHARGSHGLLSAARVNAKAPRSAERVVVVRIPD